MLLNVADSCALVAVVVDSCAFAALVVASSCPKWRQQLAKWRRQLAKWRENSGTFLADSLDDSLGVLNVWTSSERFLAQNIRSLFCSINLLKNSSQFSSQINQNNRFPVKLGSKLL